MIRLQFDSLSALVHVGEISQSLPSGVGFRLAGTGILLVSIGTALRAQAATRFVANPSHGKTQQDLLGGKLCEIKLTVTDENDLEILFLETDLLVAAWGDRRHAVADREGIGVLPRALLEAARA
jgi:hypothetical protein